MWETTRDTVWIFVAYGIAQGLGAWSLAVRRGRAGTRDVRARLVRFAALDVVVVLVVSVVGALLHDGGHRLAGAILAGVVGALVMALSLLVVGTLGLLTVNGSDRLDDRVDRWRRNRL